MATIGDIQINLTAQTTALEKGLAKGRAELAAFEKASQKTTVSISGIGAVAAKSFASFAVAQGIGKASGALDQFSSGIGPAADRIDSGFKVIGESAKFMGKVAGGAFLGLQGFVLQARRAIADFSGNTFEVEELDAQLKKLHRDMDDLSSGFDRAAFEKDQKAISDAAKKVDDDRKKSITATIETLETQARTFGMNSQELEVYAQRMRKATEAEIALTQAAADRIKMQENFDDRVKRVADVIADLQKELDEFGKTAGEIALGKALDAGATADNIEAINALNRELESRKELAKAIEEQQRAQERLSEEGQRLFEEVQTPLERYETELGKLTELLEAGAISEQTFGRAVDALDQRTLEALKIPERQQPRGAEKGSQEAFAAIARFQNRDAGQDAAKQQIDQIKQSNKHLAKIAGKFDDLEVAGWGGSGFSSAWGGQGFNN